MPEEVLAFVSLSRLASGDHTAADVLALASMLLRDTASPSTLAWYVLDPAANALKVAHASGPAADLFRGLSIPIASRLSGWVAANRQPIVNSDPALDLGSEQAAAASLQSCLSVPLVTGESLVGVLSIYASRPHAFTEDQGRLMQMIAPHVGDRCLARQAAGAGRAGARRRQARARRPAATGCNQPVERSRR